MTLKLILLPSQPHTSHQDRFYPPLRAAPISLCSPPSHAILLTAARQLSLGWKSTFSFTDTGSKVLPSTTVTLSEWCSKPWSAIYQIFSHSHLLKSQQKKQFWGPSNEHLLYLETNLYDVLWDTPKSLIFSFLRKTPFPLIPLCHQISKYGNILI